MSSDKKAIPTFRTGCSNFNILPAAISHSSIPRAEHYSGSAVTPRCQRQRAHSRTCALPSSMAASIRHNPYFVRTWKTKRQLLAPRIQVSHHDVENLSRPSRVTLGNRRLGATFVVVPVLPGNRRQTGAPTTNQSHLLCDSEPRLERPIGNLPSGRARAGQFIRASVFERVGHDGF